MVVCSLWAVAGAARRVAAVALIAALGWLAASTALAAADAPSIVGAWWRFLPNAAGPPALQVFELRDDGVFVTHGVAYLQDRGRYRFDAGTLSVESDLDPRLRGVMAYALTGADNLTLLLGPPLNQRQDWTRVDWPQHFSLAVVGGHEVPNALVALVTRSVYGARQGWQPDAVPERLHLEATKNRELQATLDLYAPATGRNLRLTISRFETRVHPYQTPARRRPAFPIDFLDLPEIVRAAQALGYDGRPDRADLLVDPTGRATWGLRFAGAGRGKGGVVLDALTGKRITVSANEIMADYNRQWDEAIAGINRLIETHAPKPQPEATGCGPGEIPMLTGTSYCQRASNDTTCNGSGGTWDSQRGICW